MKKEIIPVRYIQIKGKRYLLNKDIVALIINFAASEEADVRSRLEELAKNIMKY